jgi:hypothetical protein
MFEGLRRSVKTVKAERKLIGLRWGDAYTARKPAEFDRLAPPGIPNTSFER